jgi:hypothetical integral membrane protein (TIGR02206 family)
MIVVKGESGILQYFWANNLDIPPELYTYNFSPTHIAWAVTALILIVLAIPVYRRQSPAARKRIMQVLAAVMVGDELSTWIWAAIMGCYNLQDMLPLHLCGVSVFLEFAAVFSGRPLLKEFSYALSLPAALLAIVMPGWYYPFFSYRYLASALLHTLLTLIPVLIVWGDGFRPDYRRLPKCFLLLLVFIGVAASADLLFGGNYMFLCTVPEDTILQVFYLWFGHPGYIVPELGVMVILWVILYLPWVLADRKRQKKREAAAMSL